MIWVRHTGSEHALLTFSLCLYFHTLNLVVSWCHGVITSWNNAVLLFLLPVVVMIFCARSLGVLLHRV